MFYIEKLSEGRKKYPWFINTALPAIIVMLVLSITLIVYWRASLQQVESQRHEIVSRRAHNALSSIQARIITYEDILLTTRGLFNENAQITDRRWQQFVHALDLEERHPGVYSLGFIEVAESGGDNTAEKATITRVTSPYEKNIASETGYDVYADPEVKRSLERARDNARATILRAENFELHNSSASSRKSFLLVMPVYSSNHDAGTIEERRQELSGYAFVSFLNDDFFTSVVSNEDSYNYQLYSGAIVEENELLYDSSDTNEVNYDGAVSTSTETVSVADKALTIVVANTRSILSPEAVARPTAVLVAGSSFIFFVTGFIYLLTRTRTRSLWSHEEAKVQQAKDELLALASHQLRTPATGVKQYLGMLREGYAGPVSQKQAKLIESAYEGNERQLTIVNELLFVARLDAGKVTLDYDKINLTSLVKEIIDEQKPKIDELKQKLELRVADSDIYIEADKGYVRMALENIINNASKYTHEKGKIRVSVSANDENARITIQDTGVGVEEKDIHHLFKKFSRIPNELTGQVSGSGVGLYLVRKIIEAHSGTISFMSKINVGSTFAIDLPITQTASADKALNISQ